MKLKYHKIKNVPLEVCTAEQKIAYNLAHSNIYIIKESYDRCTTGIQKSDIVSEAVNMCITNWKNSYSYQSKYNIDAIFSALMAGMEGYMNTKYHILQSYEEIGKMFPANYL